MKTRQSLPAILFSGTLLFSACSQPAEVDYLAEIEAVNAQFEAYYNAGDAVGVDSLYTADAILFPPGGQAVSGAEARTAFWQSGIDAGLVGVDLLNDEVIGIGDMAFERGRYILFDGDGNELASGNYAVLWKNEGGTWKLHRDILNTNQPSEE